MSSEVPNSLARKQINLAREFSRIQQNSGTNLRPGVRLAGAADTERMASLSRLVCGRKEHCDITCLANKCQISGYRVSRSMNIMQRVGKTGCRDPRFLLQRKAPTAAWAQGASTWLTSGKGFGVSWCLKKIYADRLADHIDPVKAA